MALLFKRDIELSLQIKNTLKTYKATENQNMLRIEFNIEKSVKGAPSNGEIVVYGLPLSDIALISTNFNPQNGQLNPSFVSLSVGYDNNLSEILSGNIVLATPNVDTAESYVVLQVQNGYLNNLENNEIMFSMENATLKDIAENIAKNNNASLEFKGKNPNVGNYAFYGSPFLQIKRFRDSFPDKQIFLDNNKLFVLDLDFKSNKIFKINQETGLIGTPSPTAIGCEIQTLLNPFMNVGDSINLKSNKLPQLDGVYSILQLSHVGSNRGNQWLSKIVAQNRGVSNG